jgi:hypothetical protein
MLAAVCAVALSYPLAASAASRIGNIRPPRAN